MSDCTRPRTFCYDRSPPPRPCGGRLMDIVGVGSEVVECVRIGRLIERYGETFLERVFTRREVRWCQGRRDATGHFAGLWAAKQAVLRCLALAGRRVSRLDVEVLTGADGTARVHAAGAVRDRAERLGVADVLLTVGRSRTLATAHATAVR